MAADAISEQVHVRQAHVEVAAAAGRDQSKERGAMGVLRVPVDRATG